MLRTSRALSLARAMGKTELVQNYHPNRQLAKFLQLGYPPTLFFLATVDITLVYGFGHDTGRQERVIENGLSALATQDGGGNMKNGVHIVPSLADSTARRTKTTNEKGGIDNGS